MNDYIINPMVFYWIEISSSVKILFCVFSVVAVFALLVLYCVYDEPWKSKEDTQRCVRMMKFWAVALGVMLVCYTLLPSKNTLYQMMIAKYATYGNAQSLLDAIKSGTDYIVESMKAVR